ncbi:hypothetical protein LJC30_05475, partial [Odoribacter sp. OttesenSCG-928-L07]|nr:hypothetical protein [Odoribacter sp. OttesenSCG-928-L07]
MSENQNTGEIILSSVASIVSKVGLVLSRTKDALVKDLLGDTSSYFLDIKEITLDDLKKLDETKLSFEKFIESVFTRLGYDISTFEKNKELIDLVKSVVVTSVAVGEGAKSVINKFSNANETDWISIAEKANENIQSGNSWDVGYGNKEGNYLNISIGDEDLTKLINSVVEIIKLVKKFKDLEWGKMKDEFGDFFDYMEDTYFTKNFAERLFDHIIVVLLQNAKEVFADDISNIIEQIEKTGATISQEVKTLYNKVKALEEQLKREITKELEIQLKLAKAELEKLLNEQFGDFNKLGKYLNRVYAVLDFLEITTKETIEIAKYIPDTGNDKVDKYFDNALPPIEINVIYWTRIEKIFSSPIDYFKNTFSINSYDDAEELLAKVIKLANAFSVSLPDFSSTKQLLMELLIRIKDKIESELSNLSGEVKEIFNQCKEFILDLLKTLERIAIEVRDTLQDGYDQFVGEANSIFKELEGNFNEIRKELISKVGEIKDNLPAIDAEKIIENISLPNMPDIKFPVVGKGKYNVDVEEILNSTFKKTLQKKAGQYDLFKDVKVDDWAKVVSGVTTEYKNILGEMESSLVRIFNESYWKEHFEEVIESLKDEFESQTKDIPKNADELKSLLSQWIVSGKGKNPFSNFDFAAYFSIISGKIKAMLPTPEDYYKKFKSATFNAIDSLKSTSEAFKKKIIEIGETEFRKKVLAFVNDLFVEYWKELKNTLIKPIINPFLQMVEYEVKQWVNKLLKDIFEKLESIIKVELQIDESHYQYIESAKDLLSLSISTAESGINSWQDGLKFAIKLYKIIPKEIKDNLSELIDMPDITADIQLPDYKLDIDNKFLAVTLYEYPGKDEKENSGNSGSTSVFVDGSFSLKLIAFVGERNKDEKNKEGEVDKEAGIYFLPVIKGSFDSAFNLGKSHVLTLLATAALNADGSKGGEKDDEVEKLIEKFQKGAIGFFFSKSGVIILDDEKAISAGLTLEFTRGNFVEKNGKKELVPADKLQILESKYLDISLGDYPQKVHVGYEDYKNKEGKEEHGLNFYYTAEIKDAIFLLKLREHNDFFNTILKDDIQMNIESLAVGYNLNKGLTFNAAYSLRLDFDIKKAIKGVKINGLALELGSGSLHNIYSNILTTFSVDFNGIGFALSDIGLGIDFNYMKPDGSIGDFDFSGNFIFPSGIAISIDVSAVKGTGIIKYDKKKEEFIGALELKILEKFGVAALVIFNMKMPDGSKGYSFMGAISTEFSPGIPLGMGFSMQAIGGSLGLNRRLDTEKIQNAVREGTLASYMFIENLADNLDTVINNFSSFYPASKDQYFFGFLTKIAFSEVVKADLGLFIQAPNPVAIIIIGGLHVKIADKCEKLLSINAYFAGGIDFSKGFWFDASLIDSYIVGIEFYGDIAFRIYWAGKTKGFLLSIGGFHPQYTPDAGFNVGNMRRLGMKLDYEIVKFSLEVYFAITSNSFQFGAHAQLSIGWKQFGIFGYFGFDVLFMFNPFKFYFDIRAGVAVKVAGITLLSLNLALGLSGPARWNAKGTASFWFLFIKIEIGFNLHWGKSQSDTSKELIDVYPIFVENFENKNNWQLISSDITDGMVTIVKLSDQIIVMQPSDTLAFSQDAVPLKQQMSCYGEGSLGDIQKIEMKSIKIGDFKLNSQDYVERSASFAPSMVRELTNDEKLVAPSYEDMESGFELTMGSVVRKGQYDNKFLKYDYTAEFDMDKFTEAT